MKKNLSITVGWLYPDLMSIYGDRGNIITLTKRAMWRGIEASVRVITLFTPEKELETCDVLLMGGAQDSQQTIVAKDLVKKKGMLQQLIEKGIPGLYICGAYQFLGKYYKEADGSIVNGLGIFDLYTESFGEKSPRLIGNMSYRPTGILKNAPLMVGFENHGGRTYLGTPVKPLGQVVNGFGNNGEDGSEGAVYKNSLGTYSHGPMLPKNPEIADWLLGKTLEMKYKRQVSLSPLDDSLSNRARNVILGRLG